MSIKVTLTLAMVIFITACSPNGSGQNESAGGAPGSLDNQYRQMGSIAGIAERCYGSKAIPEALNPKIHALSNSPAMHQLVGDYNDAYAEGVTKQVAWNGTKGAYSSPFDCSSARDMQMIKKFESTIVANLEN